MLLDEHTDCRKGLLHRLAAREEVIPAFHHYERDILHIRTLAQAMRIIRSCRRSRIHTIALHQSTSSCIKSLQESLAVA